MQLLHTFTPLEPTRVNLDLRVLLCCPDGESGVCARRLAGLGTEVEIIPEVFTALAEVIDDPVGFNVLVLNCDTPGVGGLEGGLRVVNMMGEVRGRIPVILIAKDCLEQRFPLDRLAPIELRAPATLLSLRVAFEHALRDRLTALVA